MPFYSLLKKNHKYRRRSLKVNLYQYIMTKMMITVHIIINFYISLTTVPIAHDRHIIINYQMGRS